MMYVTYFLVIFLSLPVVHALVSVRIQQSSIYRPSLACAFIRNIAWSNDESIQSCIWACVHEPNCQTALYYSDNKTCSMFVESCKTGSMDASGNIRADVICYPKSHGLLVFSEAINVIFVFRSHSYMSLHSKTDSKRQ